MNHVTYYTLVFWVSPSPLGLVGNRWAIEHRCNACHQRVDTGELLAHAQDHARGAIVSDGPEEG